MRITVVNRGPEPATLHLLPTVWFRNTWSWDAGRTEAELAALFERTPSHRVERADIRKAVAGVRRIAPICCSLKTKRTSRRLLRPIKLVREYVRTGSTSTLCTAVRTRSIRRNRVRKRRRIMFSMLGAGESAHDQGPTHGFTELSRSCGSSDFDEIFSDRIREADEFYDKVIPEDLSADGAQCHAASFRGYAVVEAVLSLRRP